MTLKKWGLTVDGEYFAMFGYSLAQGLFNPSFSKVDFAWIWRSHIPPKIKKNPLEVVS